MATSIIFHNTYAKALNLRGNKLDEHYVPIEYLERLDHLELHIKIPLIRYSMRSRCSIYPDRLELISFSHSFFSCIKPMAFDKPLGRSDDEPLTARGLLNTCNTSIIDFVVTAFIGCFPARVLGYGCS